MNSYVDNFSKRLEVVNSNYKKDMFQSYLTAIEWRNVEMAEEYAMHLKEGNKFYNFPYFRQLIEFYKIFGNSYIAARNYNSHFDIMMSGHMLMNIFILSSVTMEYALKGLFSIPLSLLSLFGNSNKTDLQEKVAEIFNEYEKFIHHTPFYKFPYFAKIIPIWKSFLHSENKSITDIVMLFSITLEFIVRGMLSFPADYMSNSILDSAPEVTNIIVEMESENNEQLEEEFKLKVKGISDKLCLKLNIAEINLQEQIFIRQEGEKKILYANLVLPRYEEFKQVIDELIQNNIKLKKIAGQDNVQVRFSLEAKDETDLKVRMNNLSQNVPQTSQILYSYTNSIDRNKIMMALNLNMDKFNETIKDLNSKDGFNLKLVHDF